MTAGRRCRQAIATTACVLRSWPICRTVRRYTARPRHRSALWFARRPNSQRRRFGSSQCRYRRRCADGECHNCARTAFAPSFALALIDVNLLLAGRCYRIEIIVHADAEDRAWRAQHAGLDSIAAEQRDDAARKIPGADTALRSNGVETNRRRAVGFEGLRECQLHRAR